MSVLTNNYEIIRELGRGGMGTVYLAYDKRLDRQVAIKMLHVDPSLDEASALEIIQRFQKEARAIAKLNHPNIVSIYDIGEEKQQYYMVIELLEGQSLSNIVEKKHKLPIELVISIGVQICGALSYAHKNGIVHRDIKPANIMFSQDYHAKLTDFGIAQLGNDKMGLTQAGSILGSILYIPPEQLMDSRRVDHRADIYSLGATLFQLFTGRLPFEGDSVAEVITKILNEKIPSMRSFDPSIPEVVDKVINKAMKKEPDERFSSVGDLGKALSDVGEYLKNSDYQLDPVIFNEGSINIANTKPDAFAKTQIIKPDAKTQLIKPEVKTPPVSDKSSVVKTPPATKKNLTTQKISTSSLNNAVSTKGTGKNNSMPVIIIGGVVVGVIVLVALLSSIFGGEKQEEKSPEKPVHYRTVPLRTIKDKPAINKVTQPAQPKVIKPKITPQKSPVEAKPAQKPVIKVVKPVQKPVIKVVKPVQKPIVKRPAAQISRPVSVKRPAAQVITRKPAVVKKQTRPATTAKKNIGEGY